MHELGIAASVLDAVRIEVGMRPGYRAAVVALRIGSLAGLDPESLRFGFDAMVRDSDLDPLELKVEQTAGEDLDIAWIELEET
ncbi:MAG TPA: hydrogenase maturation nickel metallochaperone HypA [Thermoanaerobaculia bacterium]|nr:hydrogenase maturation nickel metallochaperone HypA [Thermoanaerobaculia bacterium]